MQFPRSHQVFLKIRHCLRSGIWRFFACCFAADCLLILIDRPLGDHGQAREQNHNTVKLRLKQRADSPFCQQGLRVNRWVALRSVRAPEQSTASCFRGSCCRSKNNKVEPWPNFADKSKSSIALFIERQSGSVSRWRLACFKLDPFTIRFPFFCAISIFYANNSFLCHRRRSVHELC